MNIPHNISTRELHMVDATDSTAHEAFLSGVTNRDLQNKQYIMNVVALVWRWMNLRYSVAREWN